MPRQRTTTPPPTYRIEWLLPSVRLCTRAVAGASAPWLMATGRRQRERRIAPDLVQLAIVDEVRGRQPTAILAQHHDVAAPIQLLRAHVERALLRGHRRILGAGAVEEERRHLPQLDAIVLV